MAVSAVSQQTSQRASEAEQRQKQEDFERQRAMTAMRGQLIEAQTRLQATKMQTEQAKADREEKARQFDLGVRKSDEREMTRQKERTEDITRDETRYREQLDIEKEEREYQRKKAQEQLQLALEERDRNRAIRSMEEKRARDEHKKEKDFHRNMFLEGIEMEDLAREQQKLVGQVDPVTGQLIKPGQLQEKSYQMERELTDRWAERQANRLAIQGLMVGSGEGETGIAEEFIVSLRENAADWMLHIPVGGVIHDFEDQNGMTISRAEFMKRVKQGDTSFDPNDAEAAQRAYERWQSGEGYLTKEGKEQSAAFIGQGEEGAGKGYLRRNTMDFTFDETDEKAKVDMAQNVLEKVVYDGLRNNADFRQLMNDDVMKAMTLVLDYTRAQNAGVENPDALEAMAGQLTEHLKQTGVGDRVFALLESVGDSINQYTTREKLRVQGTSKETRKGADYEINRAIVSLGDTMADLETNLQAAAPWLRNTQDLAELGSRVHDFHWEKGPEAYNEMLESLPPWARKAMMDDFQEWKGLHDKAKSGQEELKRRQQLQEFEALTAEGNPATSRKDWTPTEEEIQAELAGNP